MSLMNMLEAIRDALGTEMAADNRVILLGQDIGKFGGIFRATDGLLAKFGDKRVIDMPLAEGAIIGSALGLALSGLRPVAEIQFLGFTQQAFHQIVPQVARMRHRSRGRFAASMVIRAPFGGGVRTPELHSDAIESQFAQAQGLKVIAPSNPYDAKGMLLSAIRDPDPVLFCEPLHGYRFIKGEVPSSPYTIDIGKASLVSLMNAHVHGVPIVLVAAGAMYNAKSPYAELVMPADATFKTGKDLTGKTIAVPAIGDFNTLVTSMWVDQNGGDSKTLKFVEIPNTAQAPAVAEHRVDAAVLQQPDLALALETGKVKVLGLAYSAIGANFMFAGWFSMNDWAAKNPALVKTFARVAAEAAVYTNAHHAETASLLADASKMPLPTIEKMSRVDTATTLEPTIIQPIIDASAKYKLIPHGFPAKELVFSESR